MLVLESGYNLATVPLFETLALAVRPLLVADSETSLNLAGRIVEEGLPATGAFQSFFEKEELPLASLVGSRFQVSGVLKYIPSLEQCEVLIFPARVTGSGSAAKVALFSVTTAAVRPFAKTTPTLDLIRSYSQISLKNLDASLVAEISQDKQEKISQELLILAAAEMIGAAGRTLSTTLDYVKTRKQFSRPIGSFQAIGHQLSDMAVAVEASSALNRFAAWAADCDPSQLASTALACKAHASECMPRVVESALQLHGGIGFTFEYDLHLFLRRVRALALSFGRAQGLQAQLGEAALV
jgi:alkylation response protein AidB-like acyl-CoA dehydrogenase